MTMITFQDFVTDSLNISQAGQINLKRNPSKDEFQSAKVIVPCGIHSCQLVAEEECYPVIDIEIDDSSQFAHIILQEGNVT